MSNISPYRPSPLPLPHRDDNNLPFPEEEMANLRDYWIVIAKYRWTIVAFLVPVVLAATIALLWNTPLYTATTTLHVENRSPNVVGVPEAFPTSGSNTGPTGLDQYYQTQLNLLRSRSLAARVIQELGLINDPRFENFPEEFTVWVQRLVRQGGKAVTTWIQEVSVVKWFLERFTQIGQVPENPVTNFELGVPPDVIDRYLERLTITLVEASQLVQVSFISTDPALSKDVVNAHVSTFIRASLQTRFELTAEARQFLEAKVAELKARLGKSEEELNRFRKAHPIVALEKSDSLVVDRLKGLNNDLTQARSRRIELESLYHIVQQRDSQLLSQVIDNPLIRQMKEQISALEAEKARTATIFKPKYSGVDAVQQQITQAKGRMDQEIRRIVRSITADYSAARAREDATAAEMEQQRKIALDLREKAVEAAVLEREVESNGMLYESVLKRTKETDLAGTVPVSNVRVVDRADVPFQPDDAHGKRNLLLSVLIGLLGGVGVAFLRHYFDNTLRTPEDAMRFLHLPTLGLVPDIKKLQKRAYGLRELKRSPLSRGLLPRQTRQNGTDTASAISHHPYSVVSESYQNICTSLLFSLPERPPRTILITSAQPKEGKSATATNIAMTLAWNGAPVLLIDADLRNGCCHRLLGLSNGNGLTDVLTGNMSATAIIKQTPIPNLSLISRGHVPPNPARLLGSDRMKETLDSFEDEYSFIIVDSAPLLPINDTVLLSTKVDGVVLVSGQGVARPAARQACERLTYVKARILGVILNSVDLQSPEYKDYRSSYVSYYTSYPTDNP
jgi:polysaccharide biosynthesis transport protein